MKKKIAAIALALGVLAATIAAVLATSAAPAQAAKNICWTGTTWILCPTPGVPSPPPGT